MSNNFITRKELEDTVVRLTKESIQEVGEAHSLPQEEIDKMLLEIDQVVESSDNLLGLTWVNGNR